MAPDCGSPEDEGFSAESLAVVARLRSRFRGALLGLALGESLALPAQFLRPGSFTPFRDLIGGGPFDLPPGSWADDTALALQLARSLLECRHCDPADQLSRFRRWQREGEGSVTGECLGITASVSRALVDGAPSKQVVDGADALARCAPLAMWHFADEDALRRDVLLMAKVTSADPATWQSTAEFSRLLHAALRGGSIESSLTESTASAAGRMLGEVLAAIHDASGWREAVLRAVNEGGDADVRAAATGQLAGAMFGVESIPAAWLAALAGRAEIEELADALLTEVLVRMAGGDPSHAQEGA